MQSIAEAEKMHGTKLNNDEDNVKKALFQNNNLRFGEDGETFDKVSRVNNSIENGNLV